jgi:hypothetical protein
VQRSCDRRAREPSYAEQAAAGQAPHRRDARPVPYAASGTILTVVCSATAGSGTVISSTP